MYQSDDGLAVVAPMLEVVLWILAVLTIAFVAMAALAYLAARFVFLRLAERVASEIAAHIDRTATAENMTRLREVVGRGLATTPGGLVGATAEAGRKIRELAEARGLSLGEAKSAFFDRLDRTARLMDRAIPLPLVGGVGLDALLGLVPFIGDTLSAVVASTIILNSLQYGLPKTLVSKMVGNMFVDVTFGAIPVVGDLFDVLFKANTRNVALLQEYIQGERQRVDAEPVAVAAR